MRPQNLFSEAESFFASIPTPTLLTANSPRPESVTDDPRADDPRQGRPPEPMPEIDAARRKKLDRMEALTKQIGLDGDMTPEKAARLMKDPRFLELQRLGQELGAGKPPTEFDRAFTAWQKRVDAYDSATKRWLTQSGWRDVRSISGRAALIETIGSRPGRVTFTTFSTTRSFFDTNSGRLCFSGGCTTRTSDGDSPTRTFERPNPAVTQFFVGRDGYFLKFQGMKVNDIVRQQPFVYNGLLSAHLDGMPGILGAPGDGRYAPKPDARGKPISLGLLLGLPFSGTSKAQRGAVGWPDPEDRNRRWRCAWEFRPVPG